MKCRSVGIPAPMTDLCTQKLTFDQTSDNRKQTIANLQKMAVAEKREAEPTTGRRNEVGLAVGQATIELLAESCRQ